MPDNAATHPLTTRVKPVVASGITLAHQLTLVGDHTKAGNHKTLEHPLPNKHLGSIEFGRVPINLEKLKINPVFALVVATDLLTRKSRDFGITLGEESLLESSVSVS